MKLPMLSTVHAGAGVSTLGPERHVTFIPVGIGP